MYILEISFVVIYYLYTVKKGLRFSCTQPRDVIDQTLPGWGREIANLFLQCTYLRNIETFCTLTLDRYDLLSYHYIH
jgi:hypothetical protein